MGRKFLISSQEQLSDAVAFLHRAQKRDGREFFVKPKSAEQELAALTLLIPSLKDDETAGVFGAWMDLHLTDTGRTRLLGAFRRKRADNKPLKQKRRIISVSASVYKELESLSKTTGGIPMPRLLESLAAIANVDKKLQEKLLKLSVALSLK